MKRRLLEALVGLGLGIALLIWVLRGFDGSQLVALQEGWVWIVGASLAMTAAHFLRAWRWQLMLRASGQLTQTVPAFWALMVGYLANLALPRIGEFIRCTFLWRWRGVSVPVAFGSVVAERVIDLLVLAFLALGVILREGLSWLEVLGMRPWLPYLGLAAGIIAGAAWLLWHFWLRSYQNRWMSALIQGFQSLSRARPLYLVVLQSLGIWIGYWLAVVGVMAAYGEASSLVALLWPAWVLLVGSGVAMALPVPGGVGTFHAIGLALLIYLGWERSHAQLTVVAAHAMQTLLVIVLGAVGWGYGIVVTPSRHSAHSG